MVNKEMSTSRLQPQKRHHRRLPIDGSGAPFLFRCHVIIGNIRIIAPPPSSTLIHYDVEEILTFLQNHRCFKSQSLIWPCCLENDSLPFCCPGLKAFVFGLQWALSGALPSSSPSSTCFRHQLCPGLRSMLVYAICAIRSNDPRPRVSHERAYARFSLRLTYASLHPSHAGAHVASHFSDSRASIPGAPRLRRREHKVLFCTSSRLTTHAPRNSTVG